MTLLQRLFRKRDPRVAALPAPVRNQPLHGRWVVLALRATDSEPGRQHLLGIDCVAVEDGRVQLAQRFGRRLQGPTTTPGPGRQPVAPRQALLDWLEFVGPSPLVCFAGAEHVPLLRRTLRREVGLRLRHPTLELPALLLALHPGTAADGSLGGWLMHYGLPVSPRRVGPGAALATAQLLLPVLHRARRQQIADLAGLARQT